MSRKHTPFTSLSRRKRRAKTLKIKTLINREQETWGGLFYDECDHATAVASSNRAWSDIVFLGHDLKRNTKSGHLHRGDIIAS